MNLIQLATCHVIRAKNRLYWDSDILLNCIKHIILFNYSLLYNFYIFNFEKNLTDMYISTFVVLVIMMFIIRISWFFFLFVRY